MPEPSAWIEYYGSAGLIISCLIGVIIYLVRENKAERLLNAELQEKRFADIQIYNAGIDKHRETSERMADEYKLIVDQNSKLIEQLRTK